MKILLLEDQLKTIEFLETGLRSSEISVNSFTDAFQAANALDHTHYDLLIVDVGLPGKSGWDFIIETRSKGFQGIILILTAFSTTSDKVKGFEVGADDYLTKPFSMEELLARIHAHYRRLNKIKENRKLYYDDIELDLITRVVIRRGVQVHLTQKEFALLEFFLRNPEKQLSRSQITEEVWNISFDTGTNVVDVYINHLRKKIEYPDLPRVIFTVAGIGYELKKT